MSNADKAEVMNMRAYDMFPQKHKADELAKDPFPMYSYERVAATFWQVMIEEMFDRGLNEEQVECLLRSKKMRHMLDSADDEFRKLAKLLVTDGMLDSAKDIENT